MAEERQPANHRLMDGAASADHGSGTVSLCDGVGVLGAWRRAWNKVLGTHGLVGSHILQSMTFQYE